MTTKRTGRRLCGPAIGFVVVLASGCQPAPPAEPSASAVPPPPRDVETATPPAPRENHVARTRPAAIRLEPFPGVTVVRDDRRPAVELRGRVCLQEGFLEQVACAPGTREHEALIVPEASPSQIHAALLMAGFEPGAPGAWTYENDEVGATPPTGTALAILVRHHDASGAVVEEPVGRWIREHRRADSFPDAPFVFGGSLIERGPDGQERYVADGSGSIIGLVTFGDEVIGFSQVLADAAEVRAPEWEANTPAIPPLGTEVTLVIHAFPRP